MAHSLTDQINALWAATNAQWKGEIAQYFYQDYILRLQESAQRQDSLRCTLSENLDALRDALDAAEADLYA